MNRLELGIARVYLSIEWEGHSVLQPRLQERYNVFVTAAPQTHHISVKVREKASSPTHARLESVKVRQAEGGWRFVYDTFVADATLALDKVELTCVQSEYAFDTFLRALLALYLPYQRGVLMHACALVEGERAYVFAGRSGAGKSTVARMLVERAHVLSDELVVLQQTGVGWEAFGTPFWGEFQRAGTNSHAPIHEIYLLRQAKQHAIERLGRRESLTALLQCSLQFAEGPHIAEKMLEVMTDLITAVPVDRLHFLPDSGFWQLISPSAG